MIADLIGGQIQVAIDVATGALPHIRAGSVRVLAVASKRRFDALPDVPTIAETIPGYEANSWCGVGVPRGTPAQVVERLNREINAGLADPGVRAQLAKVATTPIIFTPGEFGAYMAAEVEKWGKVVRTAGVRPE
jgi:tripartite-type tricarboxylate transporter receptor subunit TctC